VKVWFKESEGKEKKYRADKIKGYSISGILNYVTIRDLDEGPFFARIIINDNLMLLASSWNCGRYYLGTNYSGPDNKILNDAIRKSRFFLLHVNKNSTHKINQLFFKEDMTEYFSDYSDLQRMIMNKELRYADIEIIVKKYNEWFSKSSSSKIQKD